MPKKKISDTLIITKKFTTPSEFSQMIEKLAVIGKSGYMETLIDFCQRNDIDIESVSKLITKSLKEKIRIEAEDLNLMKRKASPKLC